MLKIGDKVKMTKRGFKYYANIDNAFEGHNVAGLLDQKHFTSAICQQFAIRGVGTVKRFNSENDPYVRWDFSIDGIKYYYSHYFDKRDVKKLTLLDKLRLKLRNLLCYL